MPLEETNGISRSLSSHRAVFLAKAWDTVQGCSVGNGLQEPQKWECDGLLWIYQRTHGNNVNIDQSDPQAPNIPKQTGQATTKPCKYKNIKQVYQPSLITNEQSLTSTTIISHCYSNQYWPWLTTIQRLSSLHMITEHCLLLQWPQLPHISSIFLPIRHDVPHCCRPCFTITNSPWGLVVTGASAGPGVYLMHITWCNQAKACQYNPFTI